MLQEVYFEKGVPVKVVNLETGKSKRVAAAVASPVYDPPHLRLLGSFAPLAVLSHGRALGDFH